MASKNEYYDRIISSLQSELTSQKAEITNLKTTVTKQQKEIEYLKSSQQQQHFPLYAKLTAADKSQLLQQAKKECASMIQSRLEVLPSHYVSKREFDNLRTTITKTYLLTDTFTSYKKRQETRLKSIEEKHTHRLPLFSADRYTKERNQCIKIFFNPEAFLSIIKSINPQWILSILTFAVLCLLAGLLLSSITN